MSEAKPVLKKPPGYRDPNVPTRRPPPPRPNLPPSFYTRKKRRGCCRSICCCACVLIFILLVLVVAAGAIFYVVFQPKLPVFHLISLQFPKFRVTDGSVLDAQTVISIEVRNANNELKLIYDETKIHITGEDDLDLGSTILPGFTQEKKNVTVLKFRTQVNGMAVDEETASRLKKGMKSKSIAVSTEVSTGIAIGWNQMTTRKVPVNVICQSISLNQRQDGGEMPKCHINILQWINIY